MTFKYEIAIITAAIVSIFGMGILTHANAPHNDALPYTQPQQQHPYIAHPRDYGAALSFEDKSFVIAITAAALITQECGSGAIYTDGAIRFANKIGADALTLSSAATAAIAQALDHPYDRNDLIPDVSSTIAQTIHEINFELKENKLKACMTWNIYLRKMEVVK